MMLELENVINDIQRELKNDVNEKSEVIGFTFSASLYPNIFDLRAFCKNQKTYTCLWKDGCRSTKFVELRRN